MAASRPPTFKAYNVKPVCAGCGRKLAATESLWFSSDGFVLGRECFHLYSQVWCASRSS